MVLMLNKIAKQNDATKFSHPDLEPQFKLILAIDH